MISAYRSPSSRFGRALDLIERSGVAEEIEKRAQSRRGSGGRPETGISYSLKAVLVALVLLVDSQTTPGPRAALDRILFEFDDDQLRAVGMEVTDEDRSALSDRTSLDLEYRRYMIWLQRLLVHVDPTFYLPARRSTAKEDARRRAALTEAEIVASLEAEDFLRGLCNRLVAASVLDPTPDGYEGDIGVDEVIIDVAKPSEDVGYRAGMKRAAVPCAGFYYRAKGAVQDLDMGRQAARIEKMAFGVGVTAVIRMGAPGSLRNVVPVITAIDVHRPTSASVAGVRNALAAHTENGFDPRTKYANRGRNSRWPYLTVDMGYNALDGFAELLFDSRYSMLATYPKHWNLVSSFEDPAPGFKAQEPGPILGYGDVYCPAAAHLLKQGRPHLRSRSLGNDARAHDDRLRMTLPLLIGVNSRLKRGAPARGRPKRGQEPPFVHKLDVVCPAVQQRVRCHLKPDSLHLPADKALTIEPTWSGRDYRCCEKSHTTITFTPKQFKQYQGSLPPGSWTHMHLSEAYRSMTERQFAILKVEAHHWYRQAEFRAAARADAPVAHRDHGRRFESADPGRSNLERGGLGRRPTRCVGTSPGTPAHQSTAENLEDGEDPAVRIRTAGSLRLRQVTNGREIQGPVLVACPPGCAGCFERRGRRRAHEAESGQDGHVEAHQVLDHVEDKNLGSFGAKARNDLS